MSVQCNLRAFNLHLMRTVKMPVNFHFINDIIRVTNA